MENIFTNKAILCTDWQQMLNLAEMAEAIGLPVHNMEKSCFESMPYFRYNLTFRYYTHNSGTLYSGETKLTYPDFIASLQPAIPIPSIEQIMASSGITTGK